MEFGNQGDRTDVKSTPSQSYQNEDQGKDRTQKSLEREFDQIAKEYPNELPQKSTEKKAIAN